MKSALITGLIFIALIIGLTFLMRRSDGPQAEFDNGIKLAVEIADDSAEQTLGLSGHAPLDDDRGMLFVWSSQKPRTFWMKGMTFAIDILWVADGQVIGIVYGAQPPTDANADDATLPLYHSPIPADQVLEVAAGFCRRHDIRIGDHLTISD